MKTESIRNLTASAIIATALVGCSSSSTGPEAGPAGPTAYDVNFELQSIYVSGDCENTAGNPGEFAYQVRLETTAFEASVRSHQFETSQFPSHTGARQYHEDTSYDLNTHLTIRGVPDSRRDEVFLRLWVIEYDGTDRDSRMSPEQETVPVPFRTAGGPERATSIRIGRESAGCRLTLYGLPTWSPAS